MAFLEKIKKTGRTVKKTYGYGKKFYQEEVGPHVPRSGKELKKRVKKVAVQQPFGVSGSLEAFGRPVTPHSSQKKKKKKMKTFDYDDRFVGGF